MLPKVFRLTRKDFKLIQGNKKKFFSSDNFFLNLFKTDFSPSKFAVIVSRKIEKKSTKRNKLKRRIKAVVLNNKKKFKNGLGVVIVVKKSAFSLKYKDLEKELLDLFYRSKILYK